MQRILSFVVRMCQFNVCFDQLLIFDFILFLRKKEDILTYHLVRKCIYLIPGFSKIK